MHGNRAVPSRACGRAAAAALSLLALGAAPLALSAQTYWRAPGAVGGAFVGAGVGWAVDVAAWGGDLGGPDLRMTPVGLVAGGVAGFIGGLHADRRLARGDSLTRASRFALRSVLFITPVATGSAIAYAIIGPSDNLRCVGPDASGGCAYYEDAEKFASDETVALVTIGGGVVLGYLAQRRFARALHPRARVGPAPNGRGLMVSIPANW